MLLSLDIETACAVPLCTDSRCNHALIPHMARITCIGIWSPTIKAVFRPATFHEFTRLMENEFELVAHNGKFDLKMLRYYNLEPKAAKWTEDSCLMGVASWQKIPEDYLTWYEERRKELNRTGNVTHREAGMHSLKTMAPYFLGVEPFWEVDDKDNDEYVLKDAEYSYRLYEHFLPILKEQDTYEFYKEKLLPWSKMFLDAESRGVLIDLKKAEEGEKRCLEEAKRLEQELDQVWKDAVPEYQKVAQKKLETKYARPETVQKHLPLRINYDSPPQLKWLLKDYLGLDIRDFHGKESTDKEVLERLSAEGRDDVTLLLQYRAVQKLASTYYPQYRELTDQGVLRASFNLDVAVTGRTSSSTPNLQNQPSELHELFIARPGYKILTKDLEAIEPSLIAYYTEDKKLVQLIQDGLKFHAFNAKAIFDKPEWDVRTLKKEHFDEYDDAKNFGLSVIYGARHGRVQQSARQRRRNWTERQCKEIVKRLDQAWPDVKAFKEKTDKYAETNPITNLFGRKRKFSHDDIYMKNFNGLMQGGASDLLVHSAYNAVQEFKEKKIDAHFLMSVHDEAIFEIPEDRTEECDEIVTRHMTKWELPTKYGNVPLRVEGKISDCWEK